MKFIRKNTILFLVASLTLGLAPFNPPHIWGKLKWVAGGANGMGLEDWGDLTLHGVPWLLLFLSILLRIVIPKKVPQAE
ncbi:MAG: hypothetical protein ACI9J3_002181 [Parvicellaceae bacterium]|jgi:hypothetical protein